MQTTERFQKINTQSFRKKVFTGIITLVLLLGFFNSNLAHAVDGAQWTSADKNALIYNGKTFTKVTDKSKYPEEIRSKTLFESASTNSLSDTKSNVLVLNNNEDVTNAKLYSFNSSALGNLKQNGGTEDVKVDGVEEKDNKTNCNVEGGGGWAVCMIAGTLSTMMDGVYDLLQGFLKVQPLYVTSKSALFQVWDYMRNIANILFVFGFVAMIYSQITNTGISNYGIKKMLPKLLVAAVLINISYYICAIGVDISNILGAQVQNLLIGVRNDVFNNNEIVTATKNLNWSGITAAVLSGAGAVTYGAVAFTLAGGIAALPFMIMGALLVVLYSAFVSLVILAARQGIIIVLVFLSPLAFTANVLPNTEKWYGKWKNLLITMLVMYPLISLLFGGSQLAGTVIIASSNGSFLLLLLGAVVQVAPLAITPTLMKLSGSLLGRVAGMVNNPNKGLVDVSRRWLRDGQDKARNDKMINKPNSLTSKFNQIAYNRSRRVGAARSVADKYQQERFLNLENERIQKAQEILSNPESSEKSKIIAGRSLAGSYQWQNALADEALNRASSQSNANISRIKAELFDATLAKDKNGNVVGIDEKSLKELSKRLGSEAAKAVNYVNNVNEGNAAKQAERNNNMALNGAAANNLRWNDDLLNTSAGIRKAAGKNSALAAAMSAAAKENREEIESLSSLTKSLNFNNNDYGRIFGIDDNEGNKGLSIGDSIEKDGISFEITKNLRAATAEKFMGTTDLANALKVIQNTEDGSDLHANRSDLSEAFKKTKKDDVQFIGGSFMEQVAVKGAGPNEAINNIDTQYAKNISDEKIIKSSDEAMKIYWREDSIKNMSNKTVEATLNSIKSISNDSEKYGKVSAAQGAEMFKALNYFKKHYKTTYDSILKTGEWSPENIKSK